MQAFAYTHLVPAERFLLTQRWKYGGGEKFSWAFRENVLCMKAGSDQAFPFRVRRPPADAEWKLSLTNPPAWLTTVESGRDRLVLRAAPGSAGKSANLLFKMDYSYNQKDKKGTIKRRTSEIFLPALTVEVTP